MLLVKTVRVIISKRFECDASCQLNVLLYEAYTFTLNNLYNLMITIIISVEDMKKISDRFRHIPDKLMQVLQI